MTETSVSGPNRQAHGQAYDIDNYLVCATSLFDNGPPYLVLEPYDSDHKPCESSPGGCMANLIAESRRSGPIPLGELVQLAVDHENARDGYSSTWNMDGRASQTIGEIIVTAQRKALDDLRAEGRAELVGRLAALRQAWAARQQEAVYTRDAAEEPYASIFGARADLYSQMISDLDQVVTGVSSTWADAERPVRAVNGETG